MRHFSLFSNGKKIADKILIRELETEEVGIFESLRTYDGKIFRLEEHLERFAESARTAGYGFNKERARKEICNALEIFRSGRSRTATTRRDEKSKCDMFLRITLWKDRYFVMIGERKQNPLLYKKGVALKTSPVKRTDSNASPSEAKTSAYQNALLATLQPSPGYEWLFLDRNHFVTEVRIGNIFSVKNQTLCTPPPVGILNGVTRRFVIECAHHAKMRMKEVPLSRHEIFNADEAFLTNTSWEILPVRELDSRRIGTKIPGPVTLELQKIFKQKVKQEIHENDSPRPH